MNESIAQMKEYVEGILYGHPAVVLNPERIAPEYRELAELLRLLGDAAMEAYGHAGEMADGVLDRNMGSRNLLLGPLKDLQAKLSHITWQTMQVAKGNLDIEVQYLGEFSVAFKSMVEQLKKRAEVEKENAWMERQVLEAEKKLLGHELECQVRHYEAVMEINREMRAYQHDIKNHFLCLGSLLKAGEHEKAGEYLASIADQAFQEDSSIRTGNSILDALLSEKARAAKEKGIQVSLDIRLKPDLGVKPADWCAIFGNALDNALEACGKVPEGRRFITVKAGCMGCFLKIRIENSMAGELIPKGNLYGSTKAGRECHGFGLRNIEKAVQGYEGVLELSVGDEVFTLQALLCNVW